MCRSARDEFVYTFTPFRYSLLIVFEMLKAFPGIVLDENITTSSGLNLICLCVPFEILDRAAKGSPWLPVHRIVTSPGFRLFASSAEISNSL